MKDNYILTPHTLTILPTYKCTSACSSCSLECSPLLNSPKISLKDIKKYILEAKNAFDSLKIVVFSGGECFLLGEDLFKAIEYANSLGLMTRCVTNGYWATSEKVAKKKIKRLKEVGISEINFSTGDEHSMFIPFDRILLGSIICAENEINTVVSIEGHKNAEFDSVNMTEHPKIKEFFKNHPNKKKYLLILKNVWMSIHKNKDIKQDDVHNRMIKNGITVDRGCENIITNMVINPEEQLSSCCGLTFENIPEMKLGSLKKHSLKELYTIQMDDFLKIWLYVEGPEGIIEFATEKNKNIMLPKNLYHICETCAYMYQNIEIRKTISEYYHEKIDDVFFKLILKQEPIL